MFYRENRNIKNAIIDVVSYLYIYDICIVIN